MNEAIQIRQRYIDEGFIRSAKTEDGALIIYTYTDSCTFARNWDDVTINSRGHIFNVETGECVARPFPKFWNLGENEMSLVECFGWNKPYEVFAKEDGCLYTATRLNLWGGGTIAIGDIVRKRLTPTLVGKDSNGNLVPAKVLDYFNNGTKTNWLMITVDCHPSRLSGANGGNNLRITSNHEIVLNGQFKPASEARVGDEMTAYELSVSDSVLHFIEAGLLGDGCLTPLATKKRNTVKYRDCHKNTHLDYINYIKNCLGACLIKDYSYVSGFGTDMTMISTKYYNTLKFLYDKWYPNGKKNIPADLSWVDDFTVAKWYMDDGCLSHDNIQQDRAVFSTHGFCKADVERLANRLIEIYSIDCQLSYSKGWFIRVNAGRDSAINHFWESIAPYTHPSMRYKLPERYRKVPFIPYESGKELHIEKKTKILSVKALEPTKKNFPCGHVGFDIKTSTGNYFAKGVLVHNCLGTLYRHEGQHKVSSRGAFYSEMANWATAFIATKDLSFLPDEVSLVFEIVSPVSHIILNYETSTLIVLAAFNRFTGEEYPRSLVETWAEKAGLPIVRSYGMLSLSEMKRLQKEGINFEGFVIRFADGRRCKIKTEWYMARAKIMSHLSPISIWDTMVEGKVPVEYLATIPEELRPLAEGYVTYLENAYADILEQIIKSVSEIVAEVGTDNKKLALFMQSVKTPSIIRKSLFLMLSARSLDKIVKDWIYPSANEMSYANIRSNP